MANFFSSLLSWLSDPFGRREIAQKHSQVLTEMQEVTTIVTQTTKKYSATEPSFPIGDMVGSKRVRRKRVTNNDVPN